MGISWMVPEDDPTYRMLYEDIETDEWLALDGVSFHGGCRCRAFNLATRLVEFAAT